MVYKIKLATGKYVYDPVRSGPKSGKVWPTFSGLKRFINSYESSDTYVKLPLYLKGATVEKFTFEKDMKIEDVIKLFNSNAKVIYDEV